MRKGTAVIALGIALLAGGPAGAAALPVEVAIEIGLHGDGQGGLVDAIGVSGAGVAQVNGSGPAGGHLTALALPAGLASGTADVAITDPLRLPILGLRLTAGHGAGSFSEGAGFGGTMALSGMLRVCLFDPCATPPPGNISIPLSPVGAGGTAVHVGVVNVTVKGGPWTTGMVPLWEGGSWFETGFAHGPASGTSSTAAPGGVVQLVAPLFLSTNMGADALIPAVARLRVAFVPEPGPALALGLGLVVLAKAGARRRRH